MVECLKDSGKKISFMEKVNSLGLMVEATKVLTLTMPKVGMEFILGQMVKNLKANGRMETKMEKEFSLILKVSLEEVIGKTEKE